MSFLEKIRFNLWDGEEMIASLIEKWNPKKLKTEKDYELSLYNYLHDNLSELQVTRQFASGRLRADLAVEGRVIIELKNNLDSTAKHHRLLGQLTSYEDWSGAVFLVLCGKTDRNLQKEVNQHIRRLNDRHEGKFRLFEK